ncbi:hypothetical protein [Aquabacterium sp.]|uniref:hypothetical protein n=1 Tax=Aquabacterium sp. TaxID=1872578 RepID=UPI0037851C4A
MIDEAPPLLRFELERGGEPDPQGPVVWPVAAPLRAPELAQRFVQHWAAWYGPTLAPHAAAIGAQLAEEATRARRLGGLPGTEHPQAWGGPSCLPEREGRFCAVALPRWWALPIVRRRSRRLRLTVPGASLDDWWQQALPWLMPEWRGRDGWPEGLVLRLEFELRVYWGALAETGPEPGSVRWHACRARSESLAGTGPLDDTRDAVLDRRLRGGVGLLVVQPWLCVERLGGAAPAPTVGALRSGWQRLRQALRGGEDAPREPGLLPRWQADEAWWARAWPEAVAGPADLARAAGRGALLRPASRPALRHGRGAPQATHVLLLAGAGIAVREGFAALLSGDAAATPLWPGLPLLDEVATWRFEHDAWLAVEHNAEHLAAAIERQLLGTRRGDAHPGRLVLLGHSRGGLVARALLARWGERWAARGWRVDVLTLGTPHLGDDIAAGLPGWRLMLAAPLALLRGPVQNAADRARMAELLRLERWWALAPPPGLRAPATPPAAPLPRGLWLWGSAWGPVADAGPGPGPQVMTIDGPDAGVPGDGLVPLASALAGRRPLDPSATWPDEGVRAFEAPPCGHTAYLAQPAVRSALQRCLAHLLGREGSWV